MDSNYSPQAAAPTPAPVPQAMPTQAPQQMGSQPQQFQPQVQYQGSAVMQPQYQQAPMGQVLAFPTQAPPQQQDSSRQSLSPTEALAQAYQTQSGVVDRLLNVLTTPFRSPSLAEPSQALPQTLLPNSQPTHQHQYQASPQTYGTNQGYSQPSSQNGLDRNLLSQMSSPNAIASASQIGDNQVPYSPSVLNAYSVELEDRISVLEPMAQDGQALLQLMSNPQLFGEFTNVYLDQALRTPGGIDVLTNAYLPIITAINAQSQPQQPQPQQQMTQQPQQQASYNWGDGRDANAWDVNGRPSFPAMPTSSGSGSVSLEGIAPTQMWQAVDALERSGGFQGKVLVQE